MLNFLIFTPFVSASLLAFATNRLFRDILATLTVLFLAFLSFNSLGETVSYTFSPFMHTIFGIIDVFLLFFFLNEGYRHKHKFVAIFATIQLILYTVVIFKLPEEGGFDIISNQLSTVMYLVINIVGGAIIIYALEYIETEKASKLKKNLFIATLVAFLGVMNFIVSTNSIEIFFLLFELTTLCSYLLIKFRDEEKAVNNALRALWINQIGGVAILLAILFSIDFYNTVYFSELLSSVEIVYLAPITLLIISAYIKGAMFPFQSWLLGAMVAPTPVSAILHSATMVKIAPFLVLKLSESFTPFISTVVALFGAFVFVVASVMALNRDFIKEIFGLSTIALLALMIALASIGATESAIVLLVFHAISKAMLFLQAGVLEKEYKIKYLSQIGGSIDRFTLFFITIGFASLTLPPFGAFVGKFMAIISITDEIAQNPLHILTLFALTVGSVVLSILYFKTLSRLLTVEVSNKRVPALYLISSSTLFIALLVGIYYMVDLYLAVAFLLVVLTPILLNSLKLSGIKRVKEYNCAEKDDFQIASYYFSLKETKYATLIATIFITLTLMAGA
jgi:ech hydrogenase subunit A